MMPDQKDYKDHWIKDNSIFVCDGWKYGVAPDGSTVCVGPVSAVGKPQKTSETPQNSKNNVTKPITKGIIPSADIQAGVLLHKNRGGRPRKEGKVHRQTKWRREKEEQARLF